VRPQSAKAKGRRLQQEVRDAVLAAFPALEPDDVRSTSMGASGADLLLSPAARKLFPYYVECKNQEALNVWEALKQTALGVYRHSVDAVQANPLVTIVGGVQPLLVFRRNKTPTYAVVPWEHFLELVKRANGAP
jgi:hypothetical protein